MKKIMKYSGLFPGLALAALSVTLPVNTQAQPDETVAIVLDINAERAAVIQHVNGSSQPVFAGMELQRNEILTVLEQGRVRLRYLNPRCEVDIGAASILRLLNGDTCPPAGLFRVWPQNIDAPVRMIQASSRQVISTGAAAQAGTAAATQAAVGTGVGASVGAGVTTGVAGIGLGTVVAGAGILTAGLAVIRQLQMSDNIPVSLEN